MAKRAGYRYVSELSELMKAVDAFARRLKQKLRLTHLRGRRGWNDRVWVLSESCRTLMRKKLRQIEAGALYQAIDLAALAFFVDHLHRELRAEDADLKRRKRLTCHAGESMG